MLLKLFNKSCWVIVLLCASIPVFAQDLLETGNEILEESKVPDNEAAVDAAIDDDECIREYPSDSWLDITQSMTFTSMCRTVSWFDRLFGNKREFDDERFGGKLVLGFNQSEYDGFDPKLRLRIKTKLPNLSSRMSAFIGRVDEDDYISDTTQTGSSSDSLFNSSVNRQAEDDAEWLIGLGYRNPKKTKKGFDYSIGAKLSSGLNPYAKVRYRYHFKMPKDHYFRAAQTVFWKNDDGYGTSTNLDYYYVIGPTDIFQWGNSVEFTQDSEQWEWVTAPTWYHELDDDRGISLKAYVRGEEQNPVSIPEYGIGLSYRQPFLRDWLFLEALVEHEWIQDYEDEPREGSWGVGLQLEMEFGEY